MSKELLNFFITVGIIALAMLVSRLMSLYLRRVNVGNPPEVTRSRLATARNFIVVVTALSVLGVWVSEIATFALSVAAVAGAMLIVSKELIMCCLGSFIRTTSRPFQVGDVVEIDNWRGQVMDSDILTTTLLEMGRAQQFTGSHVKLPNSMLLSVPVKNISRTGKFMLNFLSVPVPFGTDIEAARLALLEAGMSVVGQYREEADEHLRRIESKQVIDLPSSEVRVLIEPFDGTTINLVLRFACPPYKRASVEQEILQRFYIALGDQRNTA